MEDGPHDKRVTAEGPRWLTTEALASAPAPAGAPLLRARAGLRPASPDGLPLRGPWPAIPGLLVATAHFRSGIRLTPAAARIGPDWIVEGRRARPGGAFLPDRLLPSGSR